jgi:hypothetical protein
MFMTSGSARIVVQPLRLPGAGVSIPAITTITTCTITTTTTTTITGEGRCG